MEKNLIITAASYGFGPSLLALLGSLNLNWPGHPPVTVYDIGLNNDTLDILEENQINVVKVPPFVPHWRKHFTWKLWCWDHAQAENFLWLDAGIVVLQPLSELFFLIDKIGYFINPTYYSLEETASITVCKSCGLEPEFRIGKMCFAAGIIGFKKKKVMGEIVKKSLAIAKVEENIKATRKLDRHDQAIVSLLIHKHIQNPIMLDSMIYAGWESPRQVFGQKLWVHRRRINKKDLKHFKMHISNPGPPYTPDEPVSEKKGRKFALTIMTFLYNVWIKFLSIIKGTNSQDFLSDEGIRD